MSDPAGRHVLVEQPGGYGNVRVGLASRGSLLEQLAELDLCRLFGLVCLPQPDALANAVADRDPTAGVIFQSGRGCQPTSAYPSAAWRRSYARRTSAERGFATIKDLAACGVPELGHCS